MQFHCSLIKCSTTCRSKQNGSKKMLVFECTFLQIIRLLKLYLWIIFYDLTYLNLKVVVLSHEYFNRKISFWRAKATFKSIFGSYFDIWNLLLVKIAHFYCFNSLTLNFSIKKQYVRSSQEKITSHTFARHPVHIQNIYWTFGQCSFSIPYKNISKTSDFVIILKSLLVFC